jgi:hypothetical protein
MADHSRLIAGIRKEWGGCDPGTLGADVIELCDFAEGLQATRALESQIDAGLVNAAITRAAVAELIPIGKTLNDWLADPDVEKMLASLLWDDHKDPHTRQYRAAGLDARLAMRSLRAIAQADPGIGNG